MVGHPPLPFLVVSTALDPHPESDMQSEAVRTP